MQHAAQVGPEGRITLDYVNPDGPVVTHMRAIMIANSLQNLKEVGLYERYLQYLPNEHRDAILYSLAASWLPIEVAVR